MLRTSWIVLFAAAFIIVLTVFQPQAEAAGSSKSCNSNTVAGHFKCQQSSGNSKGQQQNKKPNMAKNSTATTVWMFVKVFLILAVLIALIYLLLRFVNSRTKSFAEGKVVQTIGGTTVGSNKSVQIVKIGERILVVGVGESVSLLKEIDHQEEVEELLNIHNREDVIDQSYSKLRDWMSRKTSGEKQGNHRFKSMLEGRLKQMAQQRKKAIDELKKKGFRE